MLDVHPPHHPTHTWRDFFVHIATIVVGLLIAIALEQSVEALHRRHQRQELLDSLHADIDRMIYDAGRLDQQTTIVLPYLKARGNQVFASLHGRALPDPPLPQPVAADTPIFPAWQAAKATGDVSVLSPQDVKAFSEADQVVNHTVLNLTRAEADFHAVGNFMFVQGGIGDTTFDLQKLPEADKREFMALLVQAYQSQGALQREERQLRGAATAIQRGERDLTKINDAEARAISTP